MDYLVYFFIGLMFLALGSIAVYCIGKIMCYVEKINVSPIIITLFLLIIAVYDVSCVAKILKTREAEEGPLSPLSYNITEVVGDKEILPNGNEFKETQKVPFEEVKKWNKENTIITYTQVNDNDSDVIIHCWRTLPDQYGTYLYASKLIAVADEHQGWGFTRVGLENHHKLTWYFEEKPMWDVETNIVLLLVFSIIIAIIGVLIIDAIF